MMKDRKEFILKGLNCANCASKIENEVSKLQGVSQANLNLMTTKLSLRVEENNAKEIVTTINKIVKSHEPSVKVIEIIENKGAEDDSCHCEQEHEEDNENTKLFLIRLLLAVLITGLFSFLKVPDVIRMIAFLVAYVLAGYEVLMIAGKNILKGRVFDENFLMGIASLGAFAMGEQEEAVAVLVFYGVGELLQNIAVRRSKSNIANLMDIRPDYANLKNGDNISVVAPEQVQVGDIIFVKPGEKIPLDGIIVKGSSFIDTRALTGESVPREVTVKDEVLSGTINTSGVLDIEVTKAFAESTVSKILELVQNASSKKAPSEKFITKFARYYTPIVVFAAVAVAIFPPLFGFGAFHTWLYRALSFLIISCPCALVISIPLSFFGGIGGAAKQGVLIKGGNYLDALNMVDTIVFDKTGTLTKGVFQVTKLCPVTGVEESELIRLAAIAEEHSTHPIAKSILDFYNKEIIHSAEITEKAGFGIVASTSEGIIYAGNEKLMKEIGIEVPELNVTASIVHVAFNEKYMGSILVSDEIKTEVKETIEALKRLGVRRTVMLTGDQKNKAKEIAELCHLDDYRAELLPQEKVAEFERLKEQMAGNGKIVFVGDGINDAPVLACADIGIAMGGIGSDAAIEAADIVIMNDDMSKIVTAIKVARKTRRIVTQNIIFALAVKVIIMALAFFGITSIWFAIFADVGVALIALLNALRSMRVKPNNKKKWCK